MGGTDFGFGFGERARFRVSVLKAKGNVGIVLRQIPSEKTRESEDINVLDTVADEISEFARAVRGGPAPETGGAEGLEVISVLNAAIASVESGKAESVADFR